MHLRHWDILSQKGDIPLMSDRWGRIDLWQAVPWPGGLDRQVMSFQPVALAAEEL